MLYERSNEQLLLWSALYLIFYQQKFGKNTILMNFVQSIDESYQRDFPKADILISPTKGAAYCLYINFR